MFSHLDMCLLELIERMETWKIGSQFIDEANTSSICKLDLFNNIISYLFAVLILMFLQVASYFGWPVSTTHCIVGAMVGFGLAYGGSGAVFWGSLAKVTSSWVISPLMGAAVSFLVYKCIRRVCSRFFFFFF